MNMPIGTPHCLIAFCLLVALSGCSTFQSCRSTTCQDDATITPDVETELTHYPDLEAPHQVGVITLNRVVFLTGSVCGGLQRREAESVARETQGVTRVVNSIYVAW